MKIRLNNNKKIGIQPGSSKQLQRIWNYVWNGSRMLLESLLFPSQEPEIYEIVDRHGKKKWCIYDPVIDRSIVLDSPEEVCIWLEEFRQLNRFWYF